MKKSLIYILAIIALCGNQAFAQNTLTLEESIDLALKNNYVIKNSGREIEAARQQKKSALTNYFPSINAVGIQFKSEEPLMEMGLLGRKIGFLEKGKVGYINAVQPIFAGGRIINGNRLAGLGLDVSKYKYEISKDEVTLKAEEYYWQIISLEEKTKTIEKYEEMLDSLQAQVEDAYNSGIVMKNDVLKVKLKRSEVLLNKSKLENGLNLSKMAFCQYLGLPLDGNPMLSSKLEINESPKTLYIDKTQALSNRNEYKLLELSVKSEKLQTRMTLGEYLPEVAVGASYQYLKFDSGEGRPLGMVYGTVSLPISAWWGGSHEMKQRKQKEIIAENSFKDKSELLLLQIEKAWRDLNDAYTQYLLNVESRDQAAENLDINQDSYDNGLVTVSDLLEAQALYQQSEDQLTEAKANYLVKKTEYLLATGR